MAILWTYHVDTNNGVSLYKNGTLFSICTGKPGDTLQNIIRSLSFLMDLGKGILEDCFDAEECRSICKVIAAAMLELQDRL